MVSTRFSYSSPATPFSIDRRQDFRTSRGWPLLNLNSNYQVNFSTLALYLIHAAVAAGHPWARMTPESFQAKEAEDAVVEDKIVSALEAT
jgi:hypothetical protein